ncbi:hypothetical protein P153DRAFT_364513 [Dothidotthia symphoricarpi CBS 119687]|uniref:Uncharacterized protein n=1 Tax=Dothidotthia symphoricarpi CBS 119687 TaxID=1392245 RepID=A0A6A6ALW4_9PLEO|nr:uncharacterized protein P153DRAFT_364513 [Dothidotthia symphoricarpi CBS 119687]KAF2132075.1 hypothetical protein P153DRAFT_364513 [Dothidotthia symphoricarpi CBS 119687]
MTGCADFLGDTQRQASPSFVTVKYFGVNAFKFFGADQNVTVLYHRIMTVANHRCPDAEQVESNSTSYLLDENPLQIELIEFILRVQRTEEGMWPDRRTLLNLAA